ncbi:MAG: glycosyltransferase family 4 protein [Bacteroidales bacterium]|jgi:glycosyltransferase involved in cell wall biosynthesis|nr:glycosyltransferase family 4 protein [Bacteroidales bacterium]
MKIAFVGTYPPRQCGIGTFTNNLIKSITANTEEKDISKLANVIALNDPGAEDVYDYPKEVKFTIRQEHQRDYINAAKYINLSDSQVCILNHEFGIFGGDDGVYILSMLYRLKIPVIVVFHTVLSEPSFLQENIVREISKTTAKVVVMSQKARSMLKKRYEMPDDKISIIEHGVPYYPGISHQKIKEKFNFSEHKVLLTFGLISRNKGIETVINALPAVVKKHPDVLYIVMGKTHPNVLKHAGEEYRNYLNLLVKRNNLENNVIFLKTFLSEEVLFEYLRACDIYITPYLNEAQITSGTLSYAVGAGAAVLSTPYWHATELLADERGRIFDFNDSNQLASILNEILDDPEKIEKLRNNAYEYGKSIRWPLIGKKYLSLTNSIKKESPSFEKDKKIIIDTSMLPKFKLDHIKRLTDDTGIVQHARYGIPNLKEGYCLDDNARALIMALMSYRQSKDEQALDYIQIYLSYIQYMQTSKGTFRNFLSFSRNFLDEEGSEDSFGRTIWALGYLIYRSPKLSYREFGTEIFGNSIANFDKLVHLRGIANTLIGISYYIKSFPSDEEMIQKMKKMSKSLTDAFEKNSSADWEWFEDKLTYDNAILPLSLLHTVEITGDEYVKKIAIKAVKFLEKVTLSDGYLSIVGSEGGYPKGGERAVFDQQAIDTMASVRMFYQAYKITKETDYLEKMYLSYLWYLGENGLRIPLYDYETSGCCDGLKSNGVNRNQGAESTLAYLISHITVLNSIEYEFEHKN